MQALTSCIFILRVKLGEALFTFFASFGLAIFDWIVLFVRVLERY
jgi:hypothetical protein